MFAHPEYLQAIRVWLPYEGHPVEVKVAGAKNVETSYSLSVRLPLAVTPKHRGVQSACNVGLSTVADRMV